MTNQQPQPESQEHPPEPPEKKKFNPLLWFLIGVVLILVLLLAGFMGYQLMADEDLGDDANTSQSQQTDSGWTSREHAEATTERRGQSTEKTTEHTTAQEPERTTVHTTNRPADVHTTTPRAEAPRANTPAAPPRDTAPHTTESQTTSSQAESSHAETSRTATEQATTSQATTEQATTSESATPQTTPPQTTPPQTTAQQTTPAQTTSQQATSPAPAPADNSGYTNYDYNGATSDGFAANVYTAWRQNYDSTGSKSGTFSVYSPATGQNYSMTCGPNGGTVRCAGGNNALVSIF